MPQVKFLKKIGFTLGPMQAKLTAASFTGWSEASCLLEVASRPSSIAFMSAAQRTPDVCFAAVHANGMLIVQVPESLRTPLICFTAVNQCGLAIQHLSDKQRTPAVCLAALRNNKSSITLLHQGNLNQPGSEKVLSFVKNNIDDLCLQIKANQPFSKKA